MTKFDPNAAASEDSGIFGLPYSEKESKLIYIPVPWEATTSYGGGTSEGPAAILEASHQVDLYDIDVVRPYEPGLFFQPIPKKILALNSSAKKQAQRIIKQSGRIGNNAALKKALQEVNKSGEQLNQHVLSETRKVLKAGKLPAVVGGDHSVPFGAFQAVAEQYSDFGIIHFDAHSDTRNAYEGFQWSHASIMHNALERIPQIKKLVQVGIRDFCEEEVDYCRSQKNRVEIYFDRKVSAEKFAGKTWNQISEKIISNLPKNVWISFDIDGLDPTQCPHTGTPVPGGLSFQETCGILSLLAKSGRKIIGFDLNEVAPHPTGLDEWDANVGARLLYKLTAFTLASQGLCKWNSTL